MSHFMRRLLLLLMILGLGLTQSQAQFYPTQYRPPNLDWQQLSTPHFKILFPQGEDSAAWKTGRILESHYHNIARLTGGTLKNFPIILTNYNDWSNGFVSPIHFRSEMDLPPFKGKTINPKSGDWLNAVVPHELVHALQFNNMGNSGFTKIVSLFSPDLARSMHSAIPLGVLEGLAVYYESDQVTPGGGRGNYPYFTHQFNAVFDSPHRWSMGQLVHISTYTRPYDRHYIGGYELTSWLQKRYGPDTAEDAISFYADYPFLGYGMALRHATGKWPGQLYEEFEADKQDSLDARNRQAFSDIKPLPVPFEGAAIRRPKWLSDSTLVFHGSFYNARSGFYRYNLNTHEHTRLITTGIVQDFVYDLTPDKSRLIYSYYKSSPIYTNTYHAELVELNIPERSSRQLSRGNRLYGPVFAGNGYLALQTDGNSANRLVRFTPDGEPEVTPVATVEGVKLTQVAIHPNDRNRLAVVANRGGVQALWLCSISEMEEKLTQRPDVSFSGGSVFDPVWHPEGDRILFSSDYSGALNVYEYDLKNGEITQLTNSRYNALEASYSPDGERIAFVVQEENTYLPALLNRSDFYNKLVPRSLWNAADLQEMSKQPAIAGDGGKLSEEKWTSSSYSSGISWLKPRSVLPIVDEASNRDVYEIGVSLHSNNLLQQQSYSAALTFLQNRAWYDISYRNTSFFPGFKASVYSEPAYVTLPFATVADTVFRTMLREERSISLSVPVNYTFNSNVFFSSLFIQPNIRQSNIRFFELDHSGDAASDFANVSIANLYGSLSYRLQQNVRDVQPNSGVFLFSEAERYFWPSGLTIRTMNAQFRRSFVNSYAFRGGVYAFLSPLRKWNQSLRLELRYLNQNNAIFDNQFLVSDGFSEPVFPFSGKLVSFGARYTIPLVYPDNGGFLLPAYVSNVYLVAFSNTVGRYTQPDFLSSSRSVFGAGVRVQFRLSNLALDLGIGIGFEPSRKETNIFVGDF